MHCVLLLLFLHLAAGRLNAQDAPIEFSAQAQKQMPKIFSNTSEVDQSRLQQIFRQSGEADSEAKRLLEKGDLVAAERACWRALETAPRRQNGRPITSAFETLGLIRLAQKRPSDALNYFGRIYPDSCNEDLLFGMTLAYCHLKDYRNALIHYNEAMRFTARTDWLVNNDPDRPGSGSVAQIEASVIVVGVENSFWSLADHGESSLRAAEKLRPGNPMVSYWLGKALRENKKNDEAVIRLNKAAANGHGILAREARKASEAISQVTPRREVEWFLR
jgi:tetratricopeptide (TPR) repeat protein